MRFAKAIFRERRKRESWRAFSCPRSRGPRCFARLTAVSSPCGGSSGFFSARSSQRIRDGKGRLSEYLWGPLLRCVQELMYSGMDGETTAECFYEIFIDGPCAHEAPLFATRPFVCRARSREPGSIIARSTAHRPETRRNRAHFAARTRRNFLSLVAGGRLCRPAEARRAR